MTTYATFTENNDWEGETWKFYVRIEGNKKALDELKTAITRANGDSIDPVYELDLTPLREIEVDALVEYSDEGYMYFHNKLDGTLVLSPGTLDEIGDPKISLLYKGGIQDFIEDPSRSH